MPVDLTRRILPLLAFLLMGAGDTIPTMRGCPANITLTVREGEEIHGPTRTDTPPYYPLRLTIRDGTVVRGPIVISVCGTDARVEISQP